MIWITFPIFAGVALDCLPLEVPTPVFIVMPIPGFEGAVLSRP